LTLDIAPKDANELLLNAATQPGLPLIVKVPVKTEIPINLDLTEQLRVLSECISPAPAAPAKAGDNSAIAKLRVESSLSAPGVFVGTLGLTKVEIPSIVLDNLVVTIPQAKGQAYGGEVALSDATYNIAGSAIKHAQKLALANIDLAALLGKPADKDSYEVTGRASGNATLAGIGFSQPERATWSGGVDLTINNLVAMRNGGEEKTNITSKSIGILSGAFLKDGIAKRTLNIFSNDFGVFLNKMEFEPVKVSAQIDHGIMHVRRGSLIGKAASKTEGLQIDYEGDIDLATMAFKPEFKLWLTKLTPGMQQQLRLDQLDPKDRNDMLQRFQSGDFEIVLWGALNAPPKEMVSNKLVIGDKFLRLDSDVDRLIEAKKGGQPAPATPNNATQAEPAEKPKNSWLGAIGDIIKKKKD
jgi:hypothetical protein